MVAYCGMAAVEGQDIKVLSWTVFSTENFDPREKHKPGYIIVAL